MGDTVKDKLGRPIDDKTTSFRLHQFVRRVEGMFATPRIEGDVLQFDGLTIERGVTYTSDARGVRRKLELLRLRSL